MIKRKINYLTVVSLLVALIGIAMIVISFVNSISELNNPYLGREVTDAGFVEGMKYLGAGVASIGFIGSGIGQGYAAGKAAEGVSRNPEAEARIRNMMIVGAAIAETSALYALVMGILLVFVV